MDTWFQWAAPYGNQLTTAGAVIIIIGSIVAALGVYGTNLASDQKNAEITSLAKENKSLSSELYAYARGGDSYAYLRAKHLGTKNQMMEFVHHGKYPVRNLTVEVRPRDVLNDPSLTFEEKSRQFTVANLSVIVPGEQTAMRRFPFDAKSPVYRVFLRAENGSLMQMIAWVKGGDAFLQGYVVVRRANGISEELHEYADTGFPPQLLAALRSDAGLEKK